MTSSFYDRGHFVLAPLALLAGAEGCGQISAVWMHAKAALNASLELVLLYHPSMTSTSLPKTRFKSSNNVS